MDSGTDVQEDTEKSGNFSFYESPATYHADISAIRSSGLRLFDESERDYYHRYVARSVPDESTDALRLGAALDILATTPEESHRISVFTETAGTGTKAFKRAEAENPGVILLTPDQLDRVHAMRAAMHRDEHVRGLIWGRGKSQVGVRWQDQATGLWCKALMDRALFEHPGRITDLKTTRHANEDDFERSVDQYGYHRQLAWYARAFLAVAGLEPETVMLVTVAVSNWWPHVREAYATARPMDPESLVIGHAENAATLERIAECTRTGLWGEKKHAFKPVGLPEWRKKRFWNGLCR